MSRNNKDDQTATSKENSEKIIDVGDLPDGMTADNAGLGEKIIDVGDLPDGMTADNAGLGEKIIDVGDLPDGMTADNAGLGEKIIDVGDLPDGIRAEGGRPNEGIIDVGDLPGGVQTNETQFNTDFAPDVTGSMGNPEQHGTQGQAAAEAFDFSDLQKSLDNFYGSEPSPEELAHRVTENIQNTIQSTFNHQKFDMPTPMHGAPVNNLGGHVTAPVYPGSAQYDNPGFINDVVNNVMTDLGFENFSTTHPVGGGVNGGRGDFVNFQTAQPHFNDPRNFTDHGKPLQGEHRPEHAPNFADIDKNGDGQMSKDEALKMAQEKEPGLTAEKFEQEWAMRGSDNDNISQKAFNAMTDEHGPQEGAHAMFNAPNGNPMHFNGAEGREFQARGMVENAVRDATEQLAHIDRMDQEMNIKFDDMMNIQDGLSHNNLAGTHRDAADGTTEAGFTRDAAMQQFGGNLHANNQGSIDEFNNKYNQVDRDGDGIISKAEFQAEMSHMPEQINQERGRVQEDLARNLDGVREFMETGQYPDGSSNEHGPYVDAAGNKHEDGQENRPPELQEHVAGSENFDLDAVTQNHAQNYKGVHGNDMPQSMDNFTPEETARF
jgi:Ca2+-binding EF-hand superfamily protein